MKLNDDGDGDNDNDNYNEEEEEEDSYYIRKKEIRDGDLHWSKNKKVSNPRIIICILIEIWW